MDRRKVLTIFGAAWLSAIVLTWFLWSRTRAPQREKTISVAAVTRDLPAGTKLARGDIKLVSIPEKDLPKSAMVDPQAVVGRALMYPVNANETLTAHKLSSTTGAEGFPALIEPGMRGISVPINDASGVAGLIQPRAHVDVLYTRAGTMAEALTTTILEDVIVLSIGKTTEIQQSAGVGTQQPSSSSTTRAVTLLVTPDDARKLELAKNQGRLSLALRNPLDRSRLDSKEAVTAEAIDPYLFTRAKRALPVGVPAPSRDAAFLAQIAPRRKAAPKPVEPPKKVVDVYRGEKHVQESFQE
ncbi:MAG: Flp pilus assembly protein CpaB [Bryobacterales bacterium]|nr:Flp pilus assembly protein CpaB [Bryobacterales bacterium]